jgi:hypothetical protein
MRSDPGQLESYSDDEGEKIIMKRDAYHFSGHSFKPVFDRLDALMMVLKLCKDEACRNPWSELHRGSSIKSLKDALAHHYDAFYEEQPKVKLHECALGYTRDVEGPQHVNVYEE